MIFAFAWTSLFPVGVALCRGSPVEGAQTSPRGDPPLRVATEIECRERPCQ